MLSFLKTAPTRSTFTPRDHPIHIPEHTYDIEDLEGERADVLAELIAWREQHSRYLLFGGTNVIYPIFKALQFEKIKYAGLNTIVS